MKHIDRGDIVRNNLPFYKILTTVKKRNPKTGHATVWWYTVFLVDGVLFPPTKLHEGGNLQKVRQWCEEDRKKRFPENWS